MWAPSYASRDQLRDFMRVDDGADDDVLDLALATSSRSIDDACDPRSGWVRQFGRTDVAEARYYTAQRRGYDVATRGQWVVVTDDIATPEGPVQVAVDGTGDGAWVEVTGATVLPRNAAAKGEPGTAVLFTGSSMPVPPPLADGVRVIVPWGWPSVPPSVTNACLLQSERLVMRRDAPFGVAGSPELGSEIRLLAKLDPDVENMIKPFVRKIGTVLA